MKSNILSLILAIVFINPITIQSQVLDTLVDVDGHKMHFNIKIGTGIPILFESGGGNDATIWNRFLEPIHSITGTTLITYDRNGYGKSEYNSELADGKKALITNGATDLEKGLHALGYDKEIIIVAHSYGGFYAAYYAAKHSKKVKGIILIDANLSSYFTDEYVKEIKQERTIDWLNNIKRQSLPAYYECLSFYETIDIMKDVKISRSIPIIDLVAENNDERWKSCHKEFVKESPNRKGITANNCNHYLHFDNPKLAVDAIVKMYCEVSSDLDFKSILQRSLDHGLENSNNIKKQEYEYWHSERETNTWGYNFLNEEDVEKALKIFELNTILFPSSSNVWDSYGEALLKAGEKENAIKMYQKSIELNPNNENGKNVLNRLLKE